MDRFEKEVIGSLDISVWEFPEWWHLEFGTEFKYLFVDVVEDQRIVHLLTELRSLEDVSNYYEIGLFEMGDKSDREEYLSIFKGQLLINKFEVTYKREESNNV